MLEYLRLRDTGPAADLQMELAPRLNLIAGDNGLGKSFLLDVAWWALSGHWLSELNAGLNRGYPARPKDRGAKGLIEFGPHAGPRTQATYMQLPERWLRWDDAPVGGDALVVYAQADGASAVFDPSRHHGVDDPNVAEIRRPLALTENEIWNGRRVEWRGRPTQLCNGLLNDWSRWIADQGANAAVMESALRTLSPSNDPSSQFRVAGASRHLPEDSRFVPTIHTNYASHLPVLHASAAVRRICTFAYILTWAWSEHCLAASIAEREPTSEIILLFDELESHLHPRWQRCLLPALLGVARGLGEDLHLQLIATTHSPLVLASVEPHFGEEDRLFHLDVGDGQVRLDEMPWVKQGDAVNWLVSDMFGLKEARSIEAERAIGAAQALMRGETDLPAGLNSAELIDLELRRVLAGHDAFWPRWVVWTEQNEPK